MLNRRTFLSKSALLGLFALSPFVKSCADPTPTQAPSAPEEPPKYPLLITTWNHGIPANEAAWKVLASGGRAIDAVEQGVRVVEDDPEGSTVGIGGAPDRDGHVTLDACIMDETGNCGAVCFLEHIKNPISVARKVMDETPHVMLAGEGALQFALENGFEKENLLTEKSEKAWKEWLKTSDYKPLINIENHDTIGMLGLDSQGNISGACTTSGLAYKIHGRVGDSPIIGAGLYCDNEVGGAVATGMGELVMKTLGTFLVVELMRQGRSPQEACEEAVNRIAQKLPNFDDFQIGFLAINKKGTHGAYAIHKGFNYALHDGKSNTLIDSAFLME